MNAYNNSIDFKTDIQKSHLTFCYCFAKFKLYHGFTEKKIKFNASSVNKPLFQALLYSNKNFFDPMGKLFFYTKQKNFFYVLYKKKNKTLNYFYLIFSS